MKNVIWQSDDKIFRILEIPDQHACMSNLKGDCFEPKFVDHIYPEELAKEEKIFEQFVIDNGTFGYVLEKWNPQSGVGYEHVDSCWGFIGNYSDTDETFKHYIVDELKAQAI